MEEAQRESERERENRLCFGQALMMKREKTRDERGRRKERGGFRSLFHKEALQFSLFLLQKPLFFLLPKKLVSPLSIIIHYRFAHLRIYKSGERERRSEKQSLRFEQRTTQLLLIGLYIYTH